MPASLFRSRRIPQFLLCTLLIASALLMPSLLCAQAYFGTVSGELTDASGAVIPDASVTLLDEEKGFHFVTTSDTSGRYLFRSVAPGLYSVSADAKGFAKVTSARFKVDVNQNATTLRSISGRSLMYQRFTTCPVSASSV
jgi:hypothetical protein